jgi:peptidyl-prolyl cis-trans isomerase A (cyclophilin A)
MRAPLLPACCVLLLLASSSLAAPKEAPARASPEARTVTVILQTDKGEIELVLDAARAPLTVKNFLHYVDAGLFSGGVFHRTVTPGNQPDKAVKIEVIQGGIAPGKTAAQLAPIALERTKDTGLKHLDGTVSMARDTPDSAQSDFFICVGDQPALDFGGQRNPDGQGFAAFGRVVRGMDVVRAIQKAPAEGQRLTPPIQILRATRKG